MTGEALGAQVTLTLWVEAVPGPALCVPVPFNEIATVGALLETVRVPASEPLLLGLKLTVTISD